MLSNRNDAVALQHQELAALLDGLAWLRDRAERGERDTLPLLEELIAAATEAERKISSHETRISYLEGLSNSDELTGLLNRRGFHLALGAALARAQRRGETGLLVLFDLDRFKAVNDRHGHLAGDAVLADVAALLKRETRRSDAVARIGGDEFAILMSDTRRSQAAERLDRLEAKICSLQVPWQGTQIGVSASFGSAAYNAESGAQGLLFLADRALYASKRPKLILG